MSGITNHERIEGIEGKVVVITGASSGIGEATARELARRGAKVVLGARRTDRLDALVAELRRDGRAATSVKTDVTKLEDVQRLSSSSRSTNSGVWTSGSTTRASCRCRRSMQLKIDEWNQMIDVNIRGVLHGIAAALPHFKQVKSGQFINVSSLGGRISIATGAVYCGTKFAVHAISEALRQEVGGDIRVTIVAPGVVESDLAETITDPATKQFIDKFREVSIKPDAIARAIALRHRAAGRCGRERADRAADGEQLLTIATRDRRDRAASAVLPPVRPALSAR